MPKSTGRITCSMWSRWFLQTYARVIGEKGELHVINPTSPQLWHRMRVKSAGRSRTNLGSALSGDIRQQEGGQQVKRSPAASR